MTELATFGAGCFWGVEVTFRNTPGVKDALVGYLGGTLANPTYKDVCTGRTGHAEVVQVEYDPAEVSYDKLLDVFWANHNPTTLNRQGPDVGTQYRSAIFYHTPEQKRLAEESKARLGASGRFRNPIVTEITAASTFYPAEDYHQRYLEKRGWRAATFELQQQLQQNMLGAGSPKLRAWSRKTSGRHWWRDGSVSCLCLDLRW